MVNSEDKSLRGYYLTVITVAVMVSTCVVLIWSSWQVHHSYTEIEGLIERQKRAFEMSGTILYLDEVLTMSARMAATTGDLQWEQRYHRFEPQLDATINEAIAFVSHSHGDNPAVKIGMLQVISVRLLSLGRIINTGVAR